MEAWPFVVDVPQATLDDLRERLRRTRWPDEVEGAGWDYGTSLPYLRDVVEYWHARFDWRREERAMNAFPHFRAVMDGLGVHYIHARGRGPAPLPLLVTHGWPSSFVEMLPLIPLLCDPAAHGGDPADAFDVVVPSIPGFAFSDRPKARGMTRSRILLLALADGLLTLGGRVVFAHDGDFLRRLEREILVLEPLEQHGRAFDDVLRPLPDVVAAAVDDDLAHGLARSGLGARDVLVGYSTHIL